MRGHDTRSWRKLRASADFRGCIDDLETTVASYQRREMKWNHGSRDVELVDGNKKWKKPDREAWTLRVVSWLVRGTRWADKDQGGRYLSADRNGHCRRGTFSKAGKVFSRRGPCCPCHFISYYLYTCFVPFLCSQRGSHHTRNLDFTLHGPRKETFGAFTRTII